MPRCGFTAGFFCVRKSFGVQIWVCRAGALPLHPTKNLFEKRFLELQKLSKSMDK